jgi:cytochrome b subunit of formate dehydrogenase
MKTANLSDLIQGQQMVDASINEQSKRLKRIRIVARLVKWIATLSLLITLTVGIGLTFVFLFPQGPAWSVDETIWVGEGERALGGHPN